ncbi:hypothetical protein BDU57DRAFT_541914 [Ampelomyces quisqualis]|uniref:Uncharacterized protein n=1 Tax=Ampelomyces quisqualis TaxID=50730 RepID=A0A6A5QCC9_AMPQU|nr:hypothetical protein BDU57DRAFT_541914 [Ampelomyces quisqualis]
MTASTHPLRASENHAGRVTSQFQPAPCSCVSHVALLLAVHSSPGRALVRLTTSASALGSSSDAALWRAKKQAAGAVPAPPAPRHTHARQPVGGPAAMVAERVSTTRPASLDQAAAGQWPAASRNPVTARRHCLTTSGDLQQRRTWPRNR